MIPSEISGKTVRGIAKYAFESMDGDFDDYAFYDVTLEKNPRVNEYLSQLESDDDDC